MGRLYPINRSLSSSVRRVRHAGDAAEAAPNFNSASPGSAFWFVLDGGNVWRVETNGRGFVERLQQLLREEPSLPSYDGHNVDGSMVRVDGKWGPTTTRVLWAALLNAGATPGMLAAVQGAGRARSITYPALASAIWYVNWNGSLASPGVPLDQLRLPAATVLPIWGRLPPGDAAPLRATQQVSVTPPAAIAEPPPVPTGAPASVPGMTSPAPTPEPLDQDTTDDIARPSGVEPGGMSSVPWMLIGGVALAVGAVWALGSGNKRRR